MAYDVAQSSEHPSDDTVIRDALAQFFESAGLPDDGGYRDPYVRFQIGPVRFGIPNTSSRRRAVPMHDLHHLATGYDTSWIGEAEIAAWELGGGCSNYGAAWALNLMAFPIGFVLAPIRNWRAFLRGRRCRTLYVEGVDRDWKIESVGALRSYLSLKDQARAARFSDIILYLLSALPSFAGVALLVGVVWMIFMV